MNRVHFLLELGLEELPTAAVAQLSAAGAELWREALRAAAFDFETIESFATPRRLAWRISGLVPVSQSRILERKGPALAAARDAEGHWSRAALGFAASCGVAPEALSYEETAKGIWLMYRAEVPGTPFATALPELFAQVMAGLPIAKRMRWGDFEASFVRPVLTLVALQDEAVLPLEFFGVTSGRTTLGHRVHHPEPVTLPHALAYEQTLEAAHVVVDIEARKARIRTQVAAAAEALGGHALLLPALVDEVAALVEWPVAVAGHFEARFLEVPQEVLITTMQDNQKTFAVVDDAGQLMAHFVAVANLESQDPESVRRGNEKVIRPRFADAQFFWQQDLKKPLSARAEALAAVVDQEQLGSLADKSARLATLAATLAEHHDDNVAHARRAAELSKCDLLSEMVMEFPELQGIMGRHYAAHEGLPTEVASALEEQYFPLGAGGALPQTHAGLYLALADKLDTLIGGFAIGAQPTGSRDPYGLRRCAIGVIRLIVENGLYEPLSELLRLGAEPFPAALQAKAHLPALHAYIGERLQGYYREQGFAPELFQALWAVDGPEVGDLVRFDVRLRALAQFVAAQDCRSLFASAKRIGNILKKNPQTARSIDPAHFEAPEEQALFTQWQRLARTEPEAFVDAHARVDVPALSVHYTQRLQALATLAEPLAAFFEAVLVMSEEETLRRNRLALLAGVQAAFLEVADLAQLAGEK